MPEPSKLKSGTTKKPGSVGGACKTRSQGREFKSHLGQRDCFKKREKPQLREFTLPLHSALTPPLTFSLSLPRNSLSPSKVLSGAGLDAYKKGSPLGPASYRHGVPPTHLGAGAAGHRSGARAGHCARSGSAGEAVRSPLRARSGAAVRGPALVLRRWAAGGWRRA